MPQALRYISVRNLSPVVMTAQQILASLLASATAVSRSGFLGPQCVDPVGERAFALGRNTQHRGRAHNQHLANVAVALLGDGAEFLLSARGILPWRQTKPCREVAARFEYAGVGNAGRDHRCDQRPNAWNLIASRRLVGFCRCALAISSLHSLRSTDRASSRCRARASPPIWRSAATPHPPLGQCQQFIDAA